jgi:hypothetical protein
MIWRTPKLFAALALGTALSGCASAGSPASDLEVRLERTACFGTCPVYVVVVHGDGLVEYEGRRFVKEIGPRTRRISADDARRLFSQFEKARFFELASSYRAGMSDMPTFILTFQRGKKVHRVEDYAGRNAGMPEVVTELERATDQVAGTDEWVGRRR